MKRILRSRLPERLADRVPPVVTEIAIGLAVAGAMTLARMALIPWTADRAPYALVFAAVVGSAVLAGWRSGLVALLVGQALAWEWIIDPAGYVTERTEYVAALVVSTFSEFLALLIIWLYQREVDRAWARREEQVELIHHALAEIDHRTANNYQTMLALISAQANRAEGEVREALLQVADRIEAIATASKQLALSSGSLDQVRVNEQLGDLCSQIKRGLIRPGVSLDCESDEVSMDAEKAIAMSIIINELVTNSLKHAFPEGREGHISVSLKKEAGRLQLSVADDGIGIGNGTSERGTGLGTRLVDTFARQLGANHQWSSGEGGTRHLITVPA